MNKGYEWRKEDWTFNPCCEQPISEPQKAQIWEPTAREEQLLRQLEASEQKLTHLQWAVDQVYFSAHWSPDRPVPNENELWETLRDAAEIEPGMSTRLVGKIHSSDIDAPDNEDLYARVDEIERMIEDTDATVREIEEWTADEFSGTRRLITSLTVEAEDMRDWKKQRLQWEDDVLERIDNLTKSVQAFQSMFRNAPYGQTTL